MQSTSRYLLKGDGADVAVLLITFFLTVIIDLTVAIEVGVLLAIVLFVRRMMQTSSIEVLDQAKLAATEDDEKADLEDTEYLDVHKASQRSRRSLRRGKMPELACV